MTTITNTIVTESNLVNFAVDVIYRDTVNSVTGSTTVINSDKHGENRGVVVGLVMSKYTWDTENVRIHPVGRDVNTGRFVSLKDTKEDIIKEALVQANDILEYEIDTQLSQTTSQLNIEEKIENNITVVEECIFVPEDILPPSVKNVKPATRLKGSKALPKVEIPKPIVVDVKETIVDVEVIHNAIETPVSHEYDDMQYALDMAYEEATQDYYNEYDFEEPTIVMDENVRMKSREEIVREVTVIAYSYFNKECTLKSLNKDQIRQQMTFVYRNRMQHLHMYAEIVGKVISYMIDKLTSSFEAKGFTFTYKNVFQNRLVEVCKHINTRL